MTPCPKSELLEEKWNAYSHALGIVLSLSGMFFLFQQNLDEKPFLFESIFVYCISLILLFSASTIYHAVQNPKLKKKLRILDHISIYYLIAGTYTPVCLTVLVGSKGMVTFLFGMGNSLIWNNFETFFYWEI